MPACMCGCGEVVSRRFKPGHDARHKSRLFAAAREGSAEAKDEIVAMGWWHLYDKTAPKPQITGTSKASAAARRREAREARTEPDYELESLKRAARQAEDQERAAAALERLNLMRLAAKVLKQVYPTGSPRPAGLMVGPFPPAEIVEIGPDRDRLEAVWSTHTNNPGAAA